MTQSLGGSGRYATNRNEGSVALQGPTGEDSLGYRLARTNRQNPATIQGRLRSCPTVRTNPASYCRLRRFDEFTQETGAEHQNEEEAEEPAVAKRRSAA